MMSTRQRLLFFVYSDANIAGAALGILGVGLFFAFGQSLLLLASVPGLYAVGWVALWLLQSPMAVLRLQQQLSADEIAAGLEELVRSAGYKLPPEARTRVESIKNSILEILPHVADLNSADYNIYTIRQTALDYLPETLENYLKLPRAYAGLHPIREGKTAQQLLVEQLDLLDRQMKEIVQDLVNSDTQQLIAHGRFLEDKFRQAEQFVV